MANAREWVAGARPRTLSTAIAPVAVGTAAAGVVGQFRPLLALIALALALALQVGVNYANDYSDGVRGTDANRVGPIRLTASGLARPSQVRRAAFLSFGVAAVLGLGLTVLSGQWWLLAAGALAIGAAWGYTGGPRPYGYEGLGEIMVFIFFGPVAALGTMWAQAGAVTWWAAVASAGVGLWAVALLLVNNIRDVATDTATGKRTIAVRLGEKRARSLFAQAVLLPIVLAVVVAFPRPWALLALLTAAPAVLMAIAVRAGLSGPGLRPVFAGASAAGLAYGLLLALGIAIG